MAKTTSKCTVLIMCNKMSFASTKCVFVRAAFIFYTYLLKFSLKNVLGAFNFWNTAVLISVMSLACQSKSRRGGTSRWCSAGRVYVMHPDSSFFGGISIPMLRSAISSRTSFVSIDPANFSEANGDLTFTMMECRRNGGFFL